MTQPTLRTCVLAAADAVEASRDELCRLDAAAGDGDHGVTMTLAARAVRQKIVETPGGNAADLMAALALAAGTVGGVAGPIMATALLQVSATMRTFADPGARLSVAHLVACAEAAEAAISRLGEASAGDKTILDALSPAVDALRQAEAERLSVADSLARAAVSAEAGAASTAAMIARRGRASRLGERSRGLPDPGATSLAVILAAVASHYRHEAAL